MCCFSGPIKRVADTHLFARMGAQGNQVVIYSMTLDSKNDVAMILPIPVKAGSPEKSVRFIDLSGYPDFFVDLNYAFPRMGYGGAPKADRSAPPAKLEIQSVGSFEASFVPTTGDFSRLDERFRLPLKIWDNIPSYADYGFVVFKLKAGNARVHPMAFSFPTRDTSRLFFPTVHIHDGKIHATAGFDHALYCQGALAGATKWQESPNLVRDSVKTKLTQGTVLPDRHVFRYELRGRFKNEDVWVPLRPNA